MGVYDKYYLWPHHIYWIHIAFTYRILEELAPLAFRTVGTKIAPVARLRRWNIHGISDIPRQPTMEIRYGQLRRGPYIC